MNDNSFLLGLFMQDRIDLSLTPSHLSLYIFNIA